MWGVGRGGRRGAPRSSCSRCTCRFPSRTRRPAQRAQRTRPSRLAQPRRLLPGRLHAGPAEAQTSLSKRSCSVVRMATTAQRERGEGRRSHLEALAVLFEAGALLAVAPLGVLGAGVERRRAAVLLRRLRPDSRAQHAGSQGAHGHRSQAGSEGRGTAARARARERQRGVKAGRVGGHTAAAGV